MITLELTESGYVSLPGMSQIMSHLNLASDIQEAILLLPQIPAGRDAVSPGDVIGFRREIRRASQEQAPDF